MNIESLINIANVSTQCEFGKSHETDSQGNSLSLAFYRAI